MHTDETYDLGDAPPMPPKGTRVRIKPNAAAAVARQTLDTEPENSSRVAELAICLTGAELTVVRSAHTNGDLHWVTTDHKGDVLRDRTVFAYGAQVEKISE